MRRPGQTDLGQMPWFWLLIQSEEYAVSFPYTEIVHR